jgi:hypothetical protein
LLRQNAEEEGFVEVQHNERKFSTGLKSVLEENNGNVLRSATAKAEDALVNIKLPSNQLRTPGPRRQILRYLVQYQTVATAPQ